MKSDCQRWRNRRQQTECQNELQKLPRREAKPERLKIQEKKLLSFRELLKKMSSDITTSVKTLKMETGMEKQGKTSKMSVKSKGNSRP